MGMCITAFLMAGETEMLREYLQHSFAPIALHDEGVAAELETVLRSAPFFWELPDGKCIYRVDTVLLQARALMAVVQEGEVEAGGLRAWLPAPDALIYIAEHEWLFVALPFGATHPTLLCALLHTRLGAWADAAQVANGLLATRARFPTAIDTELCLCPLNRIEAWRLLARCRAEGEGDRSAALEALEHAVSESQAVGYRWTEVEALRDMMQWLDGEEARAAVRARLDAAAAGFRE